MLNPLHKNALLVTFLHIESRLGEMEHLLAQGGRRSPLNQYVHDLSPTEAKVVENYFARIRSTMVTCLEEHGIPLEVRPVSVRGCLQTSLLSLSISVAEVSPNRLRGYGELDEAGREEVLGIQQEMDRLLDGVRAYLNDRLRDALKELERAGTTEGGTATDETQGTTPRAPGPQ